MIDVSRFRKTKEDIEDNMKRREEKINYVKSKRGELAEKQRLMEDSINGIKDEIRRKAETACPLDAKTEELKELASKVEDKEPIKSRIEENRKKLMEINLKIKEQETRIKGSDELKDKIGSIDQCPTCLQPVSTEHKHSITCTENEKIDSCRSVIEDCNVRKREIENIDNALKEELEKINTREKSIEKLKAEIRSMEDVKKDIAEKQKQQNRMELEIESIRKALEKLHTFDLGLHEEALGQEKDMLRKLSEKCHIEEMIREKKKAAEASSLAMEEAQKLIAELEENSRMLEGYINEESKTEETFRRAKQELDIVREEEKKAEIGLAAVAKEAEAKEELLKGIEQEAARKLEARSRLGNTRMLQNWMEEHFISLMNTIERQVMMKIYNEFNEMFQTWFNMLIEQETLAVRLDDQFTPVIEQNGYETGLEALSGGEKTAVALAYRLALNKVINDIVGDIKTKDIIILDEPTDGFSSQQLDKLKDVIDQLGLKQVIIVSHEPKIESFVDNVVKLSKNEHTTTII